MENQIKEEMAYLTGLLDAGVEFLVSYGFQIIGALFVLFIGLKLSGWTAAKVRGLCTRRNLDPTLSKFAGQLVRILLLVVVILITLGNFGITIAPLIALAGAAAFGATIAIQGPLSNYGAGLSIILARPFVVGNTIRVRGTQGVVRDIALGATTLSGEDGEKITVPNKEIVGQIIVNSQQYRIVEPKIFLSAGQDVDAAIRAVRGAIGEFGTETEMPDPQVGLHDFAYGGVVIGVRFWVPSDNYFQQRFKINGAILKALEEADIELVTLGGAAVMAPSLTNEASDDGLPEQRMF